MDAVIPRFQFVLLVDGASTANAPAHGILASALANLVRAVQNLLFAFGTVVVARAARANTDRSVLRSIGELGHGLKALR